MLDERDIQIIKEIMRESESRVIAQMDERIDKRIKESEGRMIACMDERIKESEGRMIARMDERFKESEERMIARMDEQIKESEKRTDERMETRISASESRLIAYIESDILPKFDVLAEGHQLLRETLAPNSRVEKVEEEVAFIKPLVLSNTRDIAELKKAQ